MTIDYTADIEEMKEALRLANPRIAKNSKIVTPDNLGVTSMLHIALNKRIVLYPAVSKSAGHNEDNTMPRVHVTSNLAGCWFGYASGGILAVTKEVSDKDKKQPLNKPTVSLYKGGYYIHQIPFRCGIKPNKDLVYDSDFTDEIWMVTYNALTRIFPAEIIGLIFPSSIAYLPRTGKLPIEVATLCVKIEKGKKANLSMNNQYQQPSKKSPEYITEGHWKFDLSDEYGIQNFEKIKEKEFLELKLRSAGMLSYA